VGRWRLDQRAIAVAMEGVGQPLRPGERFTAVVELRRRGLSYLAIACRLQIDPRQVHRDLTRAGLVTSEQVPA
jgi:DNA-directed RNA polymerase specialized sigma24 family protein